MAAGSYEGGVAALGVGGAHHDAADLLHAMAPAHIRHGSTVTYKVQPLRYLPPKVCSAAVMACISA